MTEMSDIESTMLLSNIAGNFRTSNKILDVIITSIIIIFGMKLLKLIDIVAIYYYFRSKYDKYFGLFEINISCSYTFDIRWSIDPDSITKTILYESVISFTKNLNSEEKYNDILMINDKNYSNTYLYHKNKKMIIVPNIEFTLKYPYDHIKIKITRYENVEHKKLYENIKIRSKKNDDIIKFIEDCYNEYIEKKYENDKNNKQNVLTHRYKENFFGFDIYPFRTKKSFDTIFFPLKDQVISNLEKFKNNTFYSEKLTFLLHGPPGTGKTSLIEVIAKYTERSIIYCKLSKIKNLNDALQVFYGEKIPVHDCKNNYALDIKLSERILVLEDIDAECKEVHKRNNNNNNNNNNTLDLLTDIISDTISSDSKKDKDDKTDKINLSDILQLFDGLIKGYDLITIITTNNIDILDEALIRPGRITMIINMNKMSKIYALKMIKSFFPNSDISDIIINDNDYTGAELENIYQCNSNFDKFKSIVNKKTI